jgi:lipid-binding SYLF domain-containing protein
MQKKFLPSWDTTKTQSKKGFDKVWGWADKLGGPVNKLSNKIGSEAFWPTTLDKESDKAARILRSFCSKYYSPLFILAIYRPGICGDTLCIGTTQNSADNDVTEDGFYTEDEKSSSAAAGPKQKQRVLVKIPQKVIQNAVGLAIFTTMRTGLWFSGAGGSGVLVARKEDGSWSPPSGIMLHTAGLGFLVGVDIYDCVVVINNRKALESFTKVRATLGGEISAVAGPVGAGGVLESDGQWKQMNKPLFTYLKSRGFYAGVQIDGSVVIERTDENARFYGEKIPVKDILAGKVRRPPPEIKTLMETLKAAEGRNDVDATVMEKLDEQPVPGDFDVEPPEKPPRPGAAGDAPVGAPGGADEAPNLPNAEAHELPSEHLPSQAPSQSYLGSEEAQPGSLGMRP